MLTSPNDTAKGNLKPEAREAALAQLRVRSNPFASSVATAGTEDDCLRFDIPGLLREQHDCLRGIVQLYRDGKPDSQVFPVVGDRGTGKTHLLRTFRDEVQRRNDTLVVVADHYTLGQDPVDYLILQIAGFLLSHTGAGAKTFQTIADRLTGRVLDEALRRLTPPEQLTLVPPRTIMEKFGSWFGTGTSVNARLQIVQELAASCASVLPEPRVAAQAAGVPANQLVEVIHRFLQQTESTATDGILRRELYSRLAVFSLTGDRAPLADFMNGDYRQGPAHVSQAGKLNLQLLCVFIQLFRELKIPLVFVFDQLEDFLLGPNQHVKEDVRVSFTNALASLINSVPGLCIMIFAERSLWNGTILQLAGGYAAERLNRLFSLPGRPAQRDIPMPESVGHGNLSQLIQRRVRWTLGYLDSNLPDIFPFGESQLREVENKETTVRACLRKLAELYNEIVFNAKTQKISPVIGQTTSTNDEITKIEPKQTSDPQKPLIEPVHLEKTQPDPVINESLMTNLKANWKTAEAAAENELGKGPFVPSKVVAIQQGLVIWLEFLRECGLVAQLWAKEELFVDPEINPPYGYLAIIRVADPTSPGIGVAGWFGEGVWRFKEFKARLEVFKNNPPVIRTLVLCRRDGMDAISGATKTAFEEAQQAGRDIRVQQYDLKDLYAAVAFPLWLQRVRDDIDAAGPEGLYTLKTFTLKLSATLLGWIDSWRQPPVSENV